MRNILSISPRRNTFDNISIAPRRNTIDIPLPIEQVEVNGFPPSNKTERLKKSAGYSFHARDRVKIVSPIEYKNRTGYIVENEFIENNRGLMEVELDYILEDGDGYRKLIDSTLKRKRITIKHPSKQLIPYKYMKCQKQHFITNITAETLLRINNITTFISGAAIICLLFGVDRLHWNNNGLFYLFCLSQSFCVGLGFYCILILSFIGITIKRLSGENNLLQFGSVHDDCTSYYWLKSTQWSPWWMFGRPVSTIHYILKQTAKISIIFIAIFLFSIILYIADHVQWYLIILCVITVIVPSLFAIDIIRNGIPSLLQLQQQQNTSNTVNDTTTTNATNTTIPIDSIAANMSLSHLSNEYRNNNNVEHYVDSPSNASNLSNINNNDGYNNNNNNNNNNNTKPSTNPFDFIDA